MGKSWHDNHQLSVFLGDQLVLYTSTQKSISTPLQTLVVLVLRDGLFYNDVKNQFNFPILTYLTESAAFDESISVILR